MQKELAAAAALAAVSDTEESVVEDTNAKRNGNCDHCAVVTPTVEMLVCQGCNQAQYCSLACQHGAWFVRFC